MSENINDDLQKFEDIEALISSPDEKTSEVDDIEQKADDADADVVEAEVVAEDAAEEDEEADAEEADAEEAGDDAPAVSEVAEDPEQPVDIEAKAASIMMQMVGEEEKEMPSMFLSDTRFKEMAEEEELISEEKYGTLDVDAKDSYEEVDVYEEGTGKGYGRMYRRRSPLEVNAIRKGGNVEGEKDADVEVSEKAEDMDDMFDTEEEALERAAQLGCEGTHGAGGKFMPCATHDEWHKLTEDKPEAEPMAEEKSEDFLCGFQRKSVGQPCDFCEGGCAPEEGLPGLAEIETIVKTAHSGSILGSGYSASDDMFVVDVKREDGSCIEVFLSGDGDELGWLRVDESLVEGKSAEEINIVSKSDAEAAALATFTDLEQESKGEVLGVMIDIFGDEDVYVVEVEAEQKSYDFYVSVEGKVLGYDEYDLIDDFSYDMSEEEEIKALEAELEIKRMYSREQREAMAESGEAMEDGSFPIADQADLENAIQAYGRASDKEAAKAHIIKRAKELGLEEMIPEGWMDAEGDADAEATTEEAETKSDDSDMMSLLEEFNTLMEGGLS